MQASSVEFPPVIGTGAVLLSIVRQLLHSRSHRWSTPILGIEIRSRENQESHNKGSHHNGKKTTNEAPSCSWSPLLKQNGRSSVRGREHHLHPDRCCDLAKLSKVLMETGSTQYLRRFHLTHYHNIAEAPWNRISTLLGALNHFGNSRCDIYVTAIASAV
jgi:hypothetical protein